jgi:hypothetical protein
MSKTPASTDEVPVLTFTPLERPSSVRILRLLLRDTHQPIRCTLHHTSISASDYAYKVLSLYEVHNTSLVSESLDHAEFIFTNEVVILLGT